VSNLFGDHKCHANGCEALTEPKLLMCRPHWSMVSTPVQKEVYDNYRKGQSVTDRPSIKWIRAAREAINEVRKIEAEAKDNVDVTPGRAK